MKKFMLLVSALSLVFAFAPVSARNYTIYIHGFGLKDLSKFNNTDRNLTANGGYWKHHNQRVGGTTVDVGYDQWGAPHSWSSSGAQRRIWEVLRNRCMGGNRCKVICHSMGCLAFGYFNARYNRSFAYKVTHVIALASAEGGSEVASAGVWIIKRVGNYLGGFIGSALAEIAVRGLAPAIYNLQVSRARGLYNHNDAYNTNFYHWAGSKGSVLSWMLPGEDDFIVAFHSTCSYRKAWAFDNCSSSRYDTDWKHRQVVWKRACRGRRWWRVCWRYPTWPAIKVYMHSGHYKAPSSGNSGIYQNHSGTADGNYHRF